MTVQAPPLCLTNPRGTAAGLKEKEEGQGLDVFFKEDRQKVVATGEDSSF